MNPELAFEIIQIALAVAQASTSGNAQNDLTIAEGLISLISKASQAYQQQVGKPLDVSLIQYEEPLP